MNKLIGVAAMAALLGASGGAMAQGAQVQRMIRESIASYPGSCPCPYSADRGGRRCGGRSAWSRGGGRAPICFASDVRGGQVSRRR
jgi:hypothetical protein